MRPVPTVSEKSWPEGTTLGHDGALAHLFTFLRGRADGVTLIGVGHRVVHGGLVYTNPCASTQRCWMHSTSSCRSRHCTSRITSPRSAQ